MRFDYTPEDDNVACDISGCSSLWRHEWF